MKRLILSVSILLSLASIGQVPVVYYDFEDNANRNNLETSVEQAMTTGNSSVSRASASGIGLVKTSGAGTTLYNGGVQAGTGIASSGWPTASSDPGVQATEYFQVTVNTTGLYGLSLSFDMDKDNNGQSPAKVGALWSTNGVLFSAVASPVALTNNSYQTVSFALPSGADNRSSLTIRIYAFDSKKLSASANFDNFTIWATTISGVRNLLDYDAYGLSLASGTANTPRFAGNLNVNGSGTVISLNSKLNLGGTVAVGSGATFGFGSNGRLIGGGAVDLANNSTLQISSTNGSSALKGNIGSSALVALPAATVEFVNATARQYQDAAVFGNVVVNNPNGLTLTGDVVVNGDLSLKSGTLTGGANQLTIGGTLSRVNGVLDASSTEVVFNGSRSQSIAAGLFTGALKKLNSSNAVDLTWATDLTVTDGVTLGSGTLKLGTNTLILGGPVVRNGSTQTGTLDASSASVIFNGSALQTVDAGSFGATIKNVTVSNAAGVSLAGNNTVDGALTLTNGTLTITGGTLTLPVTPVRTAGSLNAAAGGVVLNGTSMQVLPAGLFSGAVKNFTAANAAGVVLNDDLTVSSALTLQAGSLSLNGKTVTVGGTVSGAGTFRGSATSGLTVATTGVAGTLNFDQTTEGASNALGSLVVASGSATLGSKLNLYSVLNVPAGGALDLAAKNLVLKSSSNNTARIAPVEGALTHATNVTVERWFPNDNRRWRMVSPGVSTVTSIKDNWMEGGMNTSFCTTCNVDPKPGYGTQITGAGGNTNGFDATPSNSASLYLYNQQTSGWTVMTSVKGTLNATTPYLIFIRGDRSVDLTANSSSQLLLPGSSTILRATGSLQIGTTTVPSLASAGKTSFVSNPYPSPISWASIFANNSDKVENYYTYWEPRVGQRGAYVTVTNTGLKSNAGTNATEEIQSGQGFFVTTKAGAPSSTLVLREQDKSTTSNINVFRTMKKEGIVKKLYASLNFRIGGSEKFNADGVLVAYGSEFSNSVDANDAVQSANWDEDIAILRDGKALSIETRSALQGSDTLALGIARLKTGVNYEWQFTPVDLSGAPQTGYLVDQFLKTETPISLRDTTTIPFAITSDPASYTFNRFMVVFKAASTVLPVRFVSVSAHQNTNQSVAVDWQTAEERDLDRYAVEKSSDGQVFTLVSTVQPKGGAANQYSITDPDPSEGRCYYRVKSIDFNGAFQYSKVVQVNTRAPRTGFTVSPNPLRGSMVRLQVAGLAAGSYTLQVKNSAGVLIFATPLRWEGVSGQMVHLPETLAAGWYSITLTGTSQNVQTILIKESF